MKLFEFLKNKLGISSIEEHVKEIAELTKRYAALPTPLQALHNLLEEPEGDDSLIIHRLRSMGLCGGWTTKEIYEQGKKHGRSET